jgi:hypothetical protein
MRPHELALWFASRPEVAQAFADPNFGRADALILVFSTLFLAPFAVFVALVLLVFATLNHDTTLTKAAGYVVLAFASLGLYLFLSTAAVSSGAGGYPLGRPIVK